MSDNINGVIQQHEGFYETLPYYVMAGEQSHKVTAMRRIQAGFDVDVYLSNIGHDGAISPDYALAQEELQKLAESISSNAGDFSIIQVIAFGSTFFLDVKNRFKRRAMLRIRITHGRGLGQPAGPPEESALKVVQEQLHYLGAKAGRGR